MNWRKSSPLLIVSTLWRYTRGSHGLLILLFFLAFANKAIDLASPYAIGQVVNILQEKGQPGADLAFRWIGFYAAVKLLASLMEAPAYALETWLGRKTSTNLHLDYYGKVQSMPLLWHQDRHSGVLISGMNKAVSALSVFIGAPQQFFILAVSFFGPILILLHIMPTVGVITLIMTFLAINFATIFDRKIAFYNRAINKIDGKIFAALTDYFGNIRTIITLQLGDHALNDVAQRSEKILPDVKQRIMWRQKRSIGVDFFVDAVVVACIAYMIHLFKSDMNAFKIGNLVMIITYLRQMNTAVYQTGRFFTTVSESITNYEALEDLDKAYNAHMNTQQNKIVIAENWQEIKVSSLNFSYAPGKAALQQLDFTLERGQKIALVGASGGGKSTLMTVLRGLYPAQSGIIDVDGGIFDSIAPLAGISTLIPQDPEIFENTIRYNISLGVEHSDDEILEACRIACFDNVLKNLPQGLDSKINEKGVNLSGGQKQRLALARGIFAIQESSLVLFDEPTSSVDSMTERQMYQNLFAAFPDICLISSIHRLNLLNQFDTIWVMDAGRLVQQGSLAHLVAQTGQPFYTLWNAYQQAETTIFEDLDF